MDRRIIGEVLDSARSQHHPLTDMPLHTLRGSYDNYTPGSRIVPLTMEEWSDMTMDDRAQLFDRQHILVQGVQTAGAVTWDASVLRKQLGNVHTLQVHSEFKVEVSLHTILIMFRHGAAR